MANGNYLSETQTTPTFVLSTRFSKSCNDTIFLPTVTLKIHSAFTEHQPERSTTLQPPMWKEPFEQQRHLYSI
jgi:hypothetical protein